jgi:hypothetical protein
VTLSGELRLNAASRCSRMAAILGQEVNRMMSESFVENLQEILHTFVDNQCQKLIEIILTL